MTATRIREGLRLDPSTTRVVNLLLLSLAMAGAAIAAATAVVALAGHPERADWLVYLGGLGVAIPLALFAARRLADRSPARFEVAAVGSAAGLTLLLACARIAYGLGATDVASGAGLLIGSLALLALPFALPRQGPGGPEDVVLGAPVTIAAGIGLFAVGVLTFAPPGELSLKNLALSLLFAAAVTLAYARLRPSAPRGGLAVSLDVAVAVLIALVAFDASGYLPGAPQLAATPTPADLISSIQLHQDFYLGPANDLLHGRAMLVGAASQYGVGSIYLLGGWFQIAPIGYGTFTILLGLLTAAEYVAAWAIMRIAGCGHLLAALGAFAILTVSLLGSATDPSLFPSFSGLRFLLLFVVTLLALRAASRSADGRPLSAAVLVATAIASIWSLETFIYTGAALAAILAVDVATRTGAARARVRLLVRNVGVLAAVCVAAHLAFALLTLALAGHLPDWGWYLAYFRTYSVRGYQSLPAGPWSTGFFVAGFYFASVAGLVTMISAVPEVARRERLLLLAIAATTAAGIGLLTYWVARSVDSTLSTLALPGVVSAVLWLALLLRLGAREGAPRLAAVAVWSWIAALVIVAGWSLTSRNWDRTALAHLLPGGRSLSGDLKYLWDSPPMDPHVREAQRLIEARFPGGDRALVMLEPDLQTETLIRTRRANLLPIGDATEDTIALGHTQPRVMRGIRELRPGTRMLIQHHPTGPGAPEPSLAIIITRSVGLMGTQRWLTHLQVHALDAIRRRFRLLPVERGKYGLEVVSLAPRRTPGRPSTSGKPPT